MPDHAIKVEWRCCAGIALEIGNFRDLAQNADQFMHKVGGNRKRRTFGHVNDNAEFRLVVKRQHLHCHPFEVKHTACEQGGDDQHDQKQVAEILFKAKRFHAGTVETAHHLG